MLLGHYPPRFTLYETDVLTTIITGLNYRGIRYVPVVQAGGEYRGVLRVGRVLRELLGLGEEGSAERLMLLRVSQAADGSVPPLTFPPRSAGEALRLMEDHRVGGLAVVLEERVVGEVTDRMLVDLLVTPSELGVPVERIASRSPYTVEANQRLHEAIGLMVEKGVRRLPVTYQGELVGMLSARDVFRYLAQVIAEEQVLPPNALDAQVWYVASPRPLSVGEGVDVSRAIDLLRREGVGSLLVVGDDGGLKGILTERDILLRLPREKVVSMVEARLPRVELPG